MSKPAQSTYTKTAMWLHWIIAALIIGQLAGGKIMHAMDPAPMKFELYQLHKSFGFIILALSIARLLWRLGHKPPALPDGMKRFETIGAKLSHIGFYILMIGIPVSGWVMVSSSPYIITTEIFKLIPVFDLPGIPRTESFNALTKDVHEYMAMAIAALLVLHIAAALKHHFISKDNVLNRMAPRIKVRR